MRSVEAAPYELVVPPEAIIAPNYEGAPEQREALRKALRNLVEGDPNSGREPKSIPQILAQAGLNVEGSTKYDPSALSRFIDGSTKELNLSAAKPLYRKWINHGSTKIDLSSIDSLFYHGALIAMGVRHRSQSELARLLSGHYFFYKRSAINPDFYVQGLLTIFLKHEVVHVTEFQYHAGGQGLPKTEESDEGFAVMKGNIIYLITRSQALKGATFTVISIHPVGQVGDKVGSEQITSLFGYQIGGREYTSPTSSPFAAERISAAEALNARSSTKGGASALGFRRDVPALMERHFRV